MMIKNRHERIIAAAPERIAALIFDLDRIWPTQIVPAPRLRGTRMYDAGLMLWEEYDRPGAARAFRVAKPHELQGEHWFELEAAQGGTVLRHTLQGCAAGKYEAIWRERIERAYRGLARPIPSAGTSGEQAQAWLPVRSGPPATRMICILAGPGEPLGSAGRSWPDTHGNDDPLCPGGLGL